MIHVLDLQFQGMDHTIASFLIETNDGLVLIETGPHSVYGNLKAAIAAKGFDIADVKHVLITHIHLDHAGACWAFAESGATIYLHPFGERHMADPSKLMASARMIYQDQMDSLWGDMRPIPAEKLRTVAHEEELHIGGHTFKSWHTPGHAVHHIAWQYGDVLFAGDVAGVRIEHGEVVPPCPPPDIHLEDWQTSIDLIRQLNPGTMYLTHWGAVTDIDAHLTQLERRLQSWAAWIKPHWEAGAKPEAITPDFQAFVQDDLRACGTSEAGIAQYEAANPSWMSVAGLLRYWKKRAQREAAQ